MSTLTGPVMQGYGAMSLTDFMKPEIAPNAEATLRHVLESGVTVINTAGLLSLVLQQDLCPLRYCSSAWPPPNLQYEYHAAISEPLLGAMQDSTDMGPVRKS